MKVIFTNHAIQRLKERYNLTLEDLKRFNGIDCILQKFGNDFFLFLQNICLVGVIENDKFIVKTCVYPFERYGRILYRFAIKFGKREKFELVVSENKSKKAKKRKNRESQAEKNSKHERKNKKRKIKVKN